MATLKFYNIFLREGPNKRVEDLVMIKDGFNFYSLIFNVLWLFTKGLFVPGFIFTIITLSAFRYLSVIAVCFIHLLLSIFLSLEGHRLLMKKYIRDDWKYLGYSSGVNIKDAKRRFLDSLNNEEDQTKSY